MHISFTLDHLNGSAQECGNSSVYALESVQSCAKPFIFIFLKEFGKIYEV